MVTCMPRMSSGPDARGRLPRTPPAEGDRGRYTGSERRARRLRPVLAANTINGPVTLASNTAGA